MENRRFLQIIIFLIILIIPNRTFGYGLDTHSLLTDETIKFYNTRFFDNIPENLRDFLIDGSRHEESFPRPKNHFYDPVNNRGLETLGISHNSSPVWANSSDKQNEAQYKITAAIASVLTAIKEKRISALSTETDFTWDRAKEFYLQGDKEKAMYLLGHILHLIQDSSIPAKTRNDVILVKEEKPYETWTEKFTSNNRDFTLPRRLKNKEPFVLSNLHSYFYGVASYSNNNFFSKNTIGIQSYPTPTSNILEAELNGYFRFGYDEEFGRYHLVKEKNPGNHNYSSNFKKNMTLDDDNNLIFKDYWSMLSTKAVQYGAGVMDLFFREVEAIEDDPVKLAEFIEKEDEKSFIGKIVDAIKQTFGSKEEFEKTEEISLLENRESEEISDIISGKTVLCSFNIDNFPTRNALIINEVAWMGNNEDFYNEWIELKNISDESIDISGYQIIDEKEQVQFVIPPETILSPGGFYLIERDNDNSAPPPADGIYNGSLSNNDEGLKLFDNQCALLDKVEADPDWPAGNNSTKQTMERGLGLSWHNSLEAGGTPRAENLVPKEEAKENLPDNISDEENANKENSLAKIETEDDRRNSAATSSIQEFSGCSDGQININTASKSDLDILSGIGSTYAQRIIELREKELFLSIDDLVRVSGLAEKKVSDIKNQGLACAAHSSDDTFEPYQAPVYYGGGGGGGSSNQPPSGSSDNSENDEPVDYKILVSEIKVESLSSSKDEFIELFNPNDFEISLNNWALKKKTSGGTESNLVSKASFSGTIPSEGYFLIVPQTSSSTEGYTGTTIPDINYSGSTYSISSDNTVLLYDPDGDLVDKVGFGSVSDYETATTTNPTPDYSISRKDDNDTDNNSDDFIISIPSPKNSETSGGFIAPEELTETSSSTEPEELPDDRSAPTSTTPLSVNYNPDDLSISFNWGSYEDYNGSSEDILYVIKEYSSPGTVIFSSTTLNYSKRIYEVGRDYTFSFQAFDRGGLGSTITTSTISIPSLIDDFYLYKDTRGASSTSYLAEFRYQNYPFIPDSYRGNANDSWKAVVLYLNSEADENNEILNTSGNWNVDSENALYVGYDDCGSASWRERNGIILPDNENRCDSVGGGLVYTGVDLEKYKPTENNRLILELASSTSELSLDSNDYVTMAFYSFLSSGGGNQSLKLTAVDKTKYHFQDMTPQHESPVMGDLETDFDGESNLTISWAEANDPDTINSELTYEINFVDTSEDPSAGFSEDEWIENNTSTSYIKTVTLGDKYLIGVRAKDDFNNYSNVSTVIWEHPESYFSPETEFLEHVVSSSTSVGINQLEDGMVYQAINFNPLTGDRLINLDGSTSTEFTVVIKQLGSAQVHLWLDRYNFDGSKCNLSVFRQYDYIVTDGYYPPDDDWEKKKVSFDINHTFNNGCYIIKLSKEQSQGMYIYGSNDDFSYSFGQTFTRDDDFNFVDQIGLENIYFESDINLGTIP